MNRKFLTGLIILLLFVSCLFAGVFFWWNSQVNPPTSSDIPISFVVERGETASSIIAKLKEKNLIKSPIAAKIYLKSTGSENQIKPGAYVLSANLPLQSVFSSLTSGPKDIWVTFPEGWRREQIAARLTAALAGYPHNFDPHSFIQQTATIEGQLFPDTYLIPTSVRTTDFISILTRNFSKKSNINPDTKYQVQLGTETFTFSGREILTLASLLEREAKSDSDRSTIAGILLSRLASNWPLQVDATVQYASDTSRCSKEILACDYWQPITNTQLPSTFNTYLHPGLPPQPIANPGLATIKAVLNPTDNPYLFYLTDPQGITHYATTLEGHNQNIDKYLRP